MPRLCGSTIWGRERKTTLASVLLHTQHRGLGEGDEERRKKESPWRAYCCTLNAWGCEGGVEQLLYRFFERPRRPRRLTSFPLSLL